MMTWLRSLWCGRGCAGTAVGVLIWKARRSGRVRWACVGLALTVALAGVALSLLPPAERVPLLLPSAPLAVAADSRASRLYLATADDRVWVLDSGKMRVTGAVDLGEQPIALAADPTSGRAYVASRHGLTVLASAATLVGPTIALGQAPTGLAIDSALHRVYVATEALDQDDSSGLVGDGSVVVVDTTRDAIVERVAVGVNPMGVAIDPGTHRVYVAVAGDGTIDVLGGEPLSVQASIAVGGPPNGVSIDPQAGRVYVTDSPINTVTVLDAARNSVQATVAVGQLPVGVAVDPATQRVFVADGGDGTIAVLHGADATPLASLRIGVAPAALAVNAAGGHIYVIDVADRSVWLIEDHRFGLPTARLVAQALAPAIPTDGQVPPG